MALVLGLMGCRGSEDPLATARELAAKGDANGAMIVLKAGLQQQPKSAEMRVLLADLLERRYDLAGAEQQLRHALDAGASPDALWPRIALLMLDRGDTENLVRGMKDRRLQDPAADAELRATVALAVLALKRGPAAAAPLLDGITTNGPAVRLARAQLMVAEGKTEQALASLNLQGQGAEAPPWWLLRAAKRIAAGTASRAASLDYIRRAHEAVPWHLGTAGEYAEALIGAERFDDAAQLRDKLRKSSPGHFWTFYIDALLQTRLGRLDAGHAAAINALRQAPDHVGAGLLAASAEVRKGDALMAEKRLQKLVRQEPGSTPALQLLAQAQMQLGRAAEAAVSVKRGLALEPNDPTLQSLKAQFEMQAGQYAQAVATLTALARAHPNEPEILLPLVQARMALGQRAGASELLQQAANTGQPPPALMARMVATALRMNDKAGAQRIAALAVERHPQDAQAHLAVAAVQSASGDAQGAWATTLALLDRQPAQANALSALAAMSRTPQQRQQLLQRHEKAVAHEGQVAPQVYLDYAALLRFEGGDDKAPLAVLERGVKAVPTSVALRQALITAYLRAGDHERAITTAQTGANVANAPAEAIALAGATYEQLDKATLAIDTYRKLVEEHPHRADWRLKLAQLEAGQDRQVQAATLLRSLIAERPFDLQPYLELARMQAGTRPAEALSVAQQLGERAEFKTASLLLAGDVLQASGNTKGAMEQFSAAAKAGGDPAAALRIVQLLDNTGRRADAEQVLADTLRRFPDSPDVVGHAAQRAQADGQAAKAADLLQRLSTRRPQDARVLNDLAWAQLEAGRPEALANARKAVAALPEEPVVLHTYGLALAKAGKTAEALTALRAAANLAPRAAVPRLHLAQHELAAGDRISAFKSVRLVDAQRLPAKDRETLARLKNDLGA